MNSTMNQKLEYKNPYIEDMKRQVDQLMIDVQIYVTKVKQLEEKRRIINCDHDSIDVGDNEHHDPVCTLCGKGNLLTEIQKRKEGLL